MSDICHIFEALSLMNYYNSTEKRMFEIERKQDKYLNLMKFLMNKGEWSIIINHFLSDYYAETIVDDFKKTTDKPITTILQGSNKDTTYIFIIPGTEKEASILPEDLPEHLKQENSFTQWLQMNFKNFSGKIWKSFFESDKQFLIPLDFFPEWFDFQLLSETEGQKNSAVQNHDDYALKIIFDEDIEFDMKFNIKLYSINDNKEVDWKKIGQNGENFYNFLDSATPFSVFVNLKKNFFINTMYSLLVNPYQSWFIALLSNKFSKIRYDSEMESVNPKNCQSESSIGKIEIWRLRSLCDYLIKFYSNRAGKTSDERHSLRSLFDEIKEHTPSFVNDFCRHCKEKRPEIFEKNEFLKKYYDTLN